MATSLAATLSVQFPEWNAMFQLQNQSRYSEALAASARLPKPDSLSRLYVELIQIHFQMCINALNGNLPKDEQATNIRRIAQEASTSRALQTEAHFLLFDAFAIYRDEAYSRLLELESDMDSLTRRRWYIRKGQNMVSGGQLQDAYDLWSPLVSDIPNTQEDRDDSLCALLVDLGRVCTELGKYSDAVEVYNQAVCSAQSSHNQGLALIRLSNALERMSRPAQADKRRIEYFNLIKREYPTQCALCSGSFGKEPKFLIPCCKTITHSECLRQVVSDCPDAETNCPFCSTRFLISDVADLSAVVGRKYKRTKRAGGAPGESTPLMKPEAPPESNLEDQ